MFIIAPVIIIMSIIGDCWHRVKIVSHLGINPVNGGIPLKDNNIIGIISCIIGVIIFILFSCELL